MAKKKRSENEKIDYKDYQWVVDNLSEAQLAAHDKNPRTPEKFFEIIDTIIDDGGQISFKKDTYNDCLMVSLIFGITGYKNSGYCTSARGSDSRDCLSILLYKYQDVAQGDLPSIATETRSVRG